MAEDFASSPGIRGVRTQARAVFTPFGTDVATVAVPKSKVTGSPAISGMPSFYDAGNLGAWWVIRTFLRTVKVEVHSQFYV